MFSRVQSKDKDEILNNRYENVSQGEEKEEQNKNNKFGKKDNEPDLKQIVINQHKTQLLNRKRSKEDIEKEIEVKKNKRKKKFQNLSKTTKYGQPIMRYRIQNILSTIKAKISKGII